MAKKEKAIIKELIEFADSCIESPCYGCTTIGCGGVEKCSATKDGYEIVEKAKELIEYYDSERT